MTTTYATQKPVRHHHSVSRPNPVAVGTVVWLGSELMFFAGLFAIYFSLRGAAPELWAAEAKHLEVPYAAVNTIILILSSFSCQFAVFSAERFKPFRSGWSPIRWGATEWLYVSIALGTIFIAGQVNEYATMTVQGITLGANAFGSVFYLTTGFHGLHVIGGIGAMLILIGRYYSVRKFTIRETTSTIVVSYYWHFVDVVWIFLFLVIYILK